MEKLKLSLILPKVHWESKPTELKKRVLIDKYASPKATRNKSTDTKQEKKNAIIASTKAIKIISVHPSEGNKTPGLINSYIFRLIDRTSVEAFKKRFMLIKPEKPEASSKNYRLSHTPPPPTSFSSLNSLVKISKTRMVKYQKS